MRTGDHLKAIDDRLGRLDAKVEARFEQVDKRFEEVDKRFEQVDKRFDQIERRRQEDRAHFDVLFEASRDDFRNLYDLVKALGEKTDARFEQLHLELRTNFADIHMLLENHETRLVILERRGG